MKRSAPVAVLALLASTVAAPVASAAGTQPPLLLPSPLPPALSALEAKADALRITSISTSVDFSVRVPGRDRLTRKLADLLDVSARGVETTSPPAAALTMRLFGVPFRLRYAAGRAYVFLWPLARHDGGRPWVEVGHGPLSRLFGRLNSSKLSAEAFGSRRFAQLFTLVNAGGSIHELAPTTLYGQAVAGFAEELDEQASSEIGQAGGALGGVAASRRAAPRRPGPKRELSIYFAASGAPVRVQILAGTAQAHVSMTIDFPAIDFPLEIGPPPAAHVISEARLGKRIPSFNK